MLAVLVAVGAAACSDSRDIAKQDFVPHTAGQLTVATTLPAPGSGTALTSTTSPAGSSRASPRRWPSASISASSS